MDRTRYPLNEPSGLFAPSKAAMKRADESRATARFRRNAAQKARDQRRKGQPVTLPTEPWKEKP